MMRFLRIVLVFVVVSHVSAFSPGPDLKGAPRAKELTVTWAKYQSSKSAAWRPQQKAIPGVPSTTPTSSSSGYLDFHPTAGAAETPSSSGATGGKIQMKSKGAWRPSSGNNPISSAVYKDGTVDDLIANKPVMAQQGQPHTGYGSEKSKYSRGYVGYGFEESVLRRKIVMEGVALNKFNSKGRFLSYDFVDPAQHKFGRRVQASKTNEKNTSEGWQRVEKPLKAEPKWRKQTKPIVVKEEKGWMTKTHQFEITPDIVLKERKEGEWWGKTGKGGADSAKSEAPSPAPAETQATNEALSRLSTEERLQFLTTLKSSGGMGEPWREVGGERDAITKKFEFTDFGEAWAFMSRTALLAEKMNHHPVWYNANECVDVTLTTNACNGLSKKDVELATKMDEYAHEVLPSNKK